LTDKEKVKEEEQNAANDTQILDKEIASWKGFEYALTEENRLLFNKMLSVKKQSILKQPILRENDTWQNHCLWL
jgi:hypothetical protein